MEVALKVTGAEEHGAAHGLINLSHCRAGASSQDGNLNISIMLLTLLSKVNDAGQDGDLRVQLFARLASIIHRECRLMWRQSRQ